VTPEPGEDEGLARMLRDGRLDDALERDRALAATEAALFGVPEAPVKFGRYVMLERIGAGGQGVVHAAYDPELDRRVAVKLLGMRVNAKHGDLVREAQAAARLAHPNVLAVHDVGTFERRPSNDRDAPSSGVYVVTELVEGETLQPWLAQRPRGLREILEVLVAAGRGLAAAHAGGIVHADVKPANVLVGRDGRARVLDFGLARAYGQPSAPDPDAKAIVVGTPAYMAPEQHAPNADLDPRADVFAFCVMAFEAITGERPFVGTDMDELLAAKRDHDIRWPPTARIPGWITRVLARGMAPARADRPASMNELLDALDRDPGRTVRNAVLASLAIGLVVLLGVGLVQQRRAREAACSVGARALEGVWAEPERQAVHAAFVAAERELAPGHVGEAWDRVARGLDAYAADWVALRESTCRATMIDEREPVPVMSARMLCLDKRAARLGGLVRRLAEVDARSVTRAAQGVAELPPLDPCMHVRADVTSAPALAREQVLALEAELADVEALRHGERFAEAEAASDRALAIAEAQTDQSALGRAWLQRGALERWRGDFVAAERAIAKSLEIAERAADDELAASALIELAFVVAVPLARPAEGLRIADLAAAKVERIAADDRTVAQLEYYRGRVLERLADYEAADTVLASGLDRALAVHGPSHSLVADIENMLGVVAERRGRHADALAHYEQAYRMRVELVGELNARTAVALTNTAVARWNLGDTRGVVDDTRRAIAVLERTLGPGHADTAWARRNLSDRLVDLERFDEARAEAELALAGSEADFGRDHPYVASSAITLAAVMRELGRLDEALALGERALAVGRAHPESVVLVEALVDRATTLRHAARCAEAEPLVVEVLAHAAPIGFAATMGHAERGRCALAEGRFDVAALELGLAIGLAEARGDGPFARLPVQLDLARALARRSPVEGRRVAEAALAVVDRTGVRPSWRAELERLRAAPGSEGVEPDEAPSP
jgi:eukaryotic-like serine/threonine-protein kinase